jgi:FtsP/CotA-like multicopper oxidase with cupredoxin domain
MGGSPSFGGLDTVNFNPFTASKQVTGAKTRMCVLEVGECDVRPDGVIKRGGLCVNGQFPGPLIGANYGDTLQITVKNNLVHEGTSMHWHGFLQTSNCHNDGVPGVQQCPIAADQSYTYTMKAELYGLAWYHSHYSGQYAGGVVGPIVIYGPDNLKHDFDLGPVMIHEWYRDDYFTTIQGLSRPLAQGGPKHPEANSNLINGKMRFDCSKTSLECATASYSKFNFTSGKAHKLRLMNVGAGVVQKFAIDGHSMTVIANDYMPVKPYNVSMISLGVGQRADVIVYGTGKPGEKYWMRTNLIQCSFNDGIQTEARAVVYYEDADTNSLPTAPFNFDPTNSSAPQLCGNDPSVNTEPSYLIRAAPPDITQTFEIRAVSNGTNIVYTFGNRTFRANFNAPLYWKVLNNTIREVPVDRNLWNVGNAQTARVIIYNYNDQGHPIHYHGELFFFTDCGKEGTCTDDL